MIKWGVIKKDFSVHWGIFWWIPMIIMVSLIIGALPMLIPCIIISVTGAKIWEGISSRQRKSVI